MAGQPRDLLTMLADRGEEAISKLADTPGADRLLGVAQTLRERLDEMQKKVRGIDQLEARVEALEKRLDELAAPSAGKKPATARKRARPAAPKTSATGTKRRGGSSGRTGPSSPG